MLELNIPAVSCGHCVRAVTQAVQQLDPAAKVDVDLNSHTVRIVSAQSPQALAAVLTEAGYPPG